MNLIIFLNKHLIKKKLKEIDLSTGNHKPFLQFNTVFLYNDPTLEKQFKADKGFFFQMHAFHRESLDVQLLLRNY